MPQMKNHNVFVISFQQLDQVSLGNEVELTNDFRTRSIEGIHLSSGQRLFDIEKGPVILTNGDKLVLDNIKS